MKLHPPQPVPGLQQLLFFVSVPVEMGNPPEQRMLPAFAASHEAHTSFRLGPLSISIIF